MVSLQDLKFLEEEVIENYKQLHRHPEVGFTEFWTAEYIYQELTRYGIPARKVLGGVGVIGDITGAKPGLRVALRADIDALPIQEGDDLDYKSENAGVMHACGHDSHAAMLLGAAHYLQLHKDELEGSVRLIFQPSEEGMSVEGRIFAKAHGGAHEGGAASMVNVGCMEGVDKVFGVHCDPSQSVGHIRIARDRAMAACFRFDLIIKGKGGHGAMPDRAVDPVGALAAILAAYNGLPAREFSAIDTIVLTVGNISTNSSWNIIPEYFHVSGTTRTFNDQISEDLNVRMKELAEGICAAHRCTAEFKADRMAIATINHPEYSQKMADMACKLWGEGHGVVTDIPLMGAEDVAYMLNKAPGTFGFLGCKIEDGVARAHHNPNFKINLDMLLHGVQLHVNMAMTECKN